MSYCSSIRDAAAVDGWNKAYHDTEYGFPLRSDSELFERLMLEINQAGLSWLTILKKKEAFHRAFEGFDPERVAAYGLQERERLLADAGIIRNRMKVDAAIENARRILRLRERHGSFSGWLDAHHPMPLDGWKKLFRKTFVFTGGEIVNEFLLSSGYLAGAHDAECPVFAQIVPLQPPFLRTSINDAHPVKRPPHKHQGD